MGIWIKNHEGNLISLDGKNIYKSGVANDGDGNARLQLKAGDDPITAFIEGTEAHVLAEIQAKIDALLSKMNQDGGTTVIIDIDDF
jgi:hypothetical protein